jgi:hypothetical protein
LSQETEPLLAFCTRASAHPIGPRVQPKDRIAEAGIFQQELLLLCATSVKHASYIGPRSLVGHNDCVFEV